MTLQCPSRRSRQRVVRRPIPDRWRANWIDGPIPLPFAGGIGDYAKDEFTGTSAWFREKLKEKA